MGRVMSLLMFVSLGLVPIGDELMGPAIGWSVTNTMLSSSTQLKLDCAVSSVPNGRVDYAYRKI